MNKNISLCQGPRSNDTKLYVYEEYYFGKRDKENQRSGKGKNHWSGPHSLEWYEGSFSLDALNGEGEYRWRHLGGIPSLHRDVTYEGFLLANQLHGYGCMSYPDGLTFHGIYCNNLRWGPGIEADINLHDNVGLWSGHQLVRLSWRPAPPSIIPDLLSLPSGRLYVEPYRSLLMHHTKTIGSTNSAIDLLKQFGSDPVKANKNWKSLYLSRCDDLESEVCRKADFINNYYHGKYHQLQEIGFIPQIQDGSEISGESSLNRDIYYAWNNNITMVHMMKHCFTHEHQRDPTQVNLTAVLQGPRNKFRNAGLHEMYCRSLLMSSYLGDVVRVTRFVNELGVHPDVADLQGNTALMYAVCGCQTDVIHFLVEAGANINSYNDSCFTPLGIALTQLLCLQKDVRPSQTVLSLLPPTMPTTVHQDHSPVSDWIISRELPNENIASAHSTVSNIKSKVPAKPITSAKDKSQASFGDSFIPHKEQHNLSNEIDDFTKELISLNNIELQYHTAVNQLFTLPILQPAQYLFVAEDMVRAVSQSIDNSKKPVDKNVKKPLPKEASQVRNNVKRSKEMLAQTTEEKGNSLTSIQREKLEKLNLIKNTITQLLSDGARPSSVVCPQPALVLATMSGEPELITQLVNYGANVHEKYPQISNYSALDIVISEPLTENSLELTRTLLNCGASPNSRLDYYEIVNNAPVFVPGPTLMHVILTKNPTNSTEEEILQAMINVFLQFKYDSTVLYQGRSAIDVAMSTKLELLDIFVKNRHTNLNAMINDSCQTVLVKMFSTTFFKTLDNVERLQTFTNLLLFGADPFIECQEEENTFSNIFVYANHCLNKDILKDKPNEASPVSKTNGAKAKKDDKNQKNQKTAPKTGKADAEMLLADYKQAINVVADCARLLITRWLQAKLMNELVEIIVKYQHRQWNMILKEHKNKKCTGLWLNHLRCLEIWDIMKKTKNNNYKDKRVLKYLISFIIFYNRRNIINNFKRPITSIEKNEIDKEVFLFLLENKELAKNEYNDNFLQGHYVKPELDKGDEKKYYVCYECMMPLTDEIIRCKNCKLVSFCSLACIAVNVDRIGGHPCSVILKEKYFPDTTPEINNSDV